MKTNIISHVLMIDDDAPLVGVMSMRLRQAGYEVDTAIQSKDGYALACNQPYDIIILDLMMPGLSGFDVCSGLRSQGVLTPILMLSGKAEKTNIVQGLDLGADDYLTKPFSHDELIARLKALVRRNKRTFNTRWVSKAGLMLDITTNIARYGDKTALLTRKEALLLSRLMYEAPETVGRELLLKDVWEIDDMHTSNRLDVYVRRLRSKLQTIGADELVHTMRGSGYRFGDDKSA
jgi:DNA-binding response OmpR family regulator